MNIEKREQFLWAIDWMQRNLIINGYHITYNKDQTADALLNFTFRQSNTFPPEVSMTKQFAHFIQAEELGEIAGHMRDLIRENKEMATHHMKAMGDAREERLKLIAEAETLTTANKDLLSYNSNLEGALSHSGLMAEGQAGRIRDLSREREAQIRRIGDLSEQVDMVSRERDELKEIVQTFQGVTRSQAERIENSKSANKDLLATCESLQETLRVVIGKYEASQISLFDAQFHALMLSGKLKKKAAEVEGLTSKSEATELASRVLYLEKQLGFVIKEKNDLASKTNTRIFQLAQEKSELAEELASANTHNKSIGAQLASLEERHKALVRNQNKLLGRCRDIEVGKIQLEGRLDTALAVTVSRERDIARLREECASRAMKINQMTDVQNATSNELREVKARADQLGNLNVGLASRVAKAEGEVAASVLGNPAYKAAVKRLNEIEADFATLKDRNDDNVRFLQAATKENKELRGAINLIQGTLNKL